MWMSSICYALPWFSGLARSISPPAGLPATGLPTNSPLSVPVRHARGNLSPGLLLGAALLYREGAVC